MGELTVTSPGLLTCVQDQGRPGYAFYAIPRSGSMDPFAASLANALLLNDRNAPVLECHYLPPTLRFATDATISLTGADMGWRLDGISVSDLKSVFVGAGSVLSGVASTNGCRAYIGIHGFIKTERSFGSASCYPLGGFGGNSGNPLALGDRVSWDLAPNPATSVCLELSNISADSERDTLPIIAGPEYHWLCDQSKTALETGRFSVTPDSDRMGARLAGPTLNTNGRALTDSLPLLPGFVQLPPSGQMIVVLQDGQTTGGYPRIAYLPPKTLCRLNQTPLKKPFRFRVLERDSV